MPLYSDLHFDSVIATSEYVNSTYGHQRTTSGPASGAADLRQLVIIEGEIDQNDQQLHSDSVVDSTKATHFTVQLVSNSPAIDSTTNSPIAPTSTELRSTLTLEDNSGDSADTNADERIPDNGTSPDQSKTYNGLFLALTTVVQVEPTSSSSATATPAVSHTRLFWLKQGTLHAITSDTNWCFTNDSTTYQSSFPTSGARNVCCAALHVTTQTNASGNMEAGDLHQTGMPYVTLGAIYTDSNGKDPTEGFHIAGDLRPAFRDAFDDLVDEINARLPNTSSCGQHDFGDHDMLKNGGIQVCGYDYGTGTSHHFSRAHSVLTLVEFKLEYLNSSSVWHCETYTIDEVGGHNWSPAVSAGGPSGSGGFVSVWTGNAMKGVKNYFDGVSASWNTANDTLVPAHSTWSSTELSNSHNVQWSTKYLYLEKRHGYSVGQANSDPWDMADESGDGTNWFSGGNAVRFRYNTSNTNDDDAGQLATAHGDPHITTLNGEKYKFDYLGSFRLIEYKNDKDLLIINGFSENGPGRWNKLQYIKKIFVKHNNNYLIADLGFRGSCVKILENNGFEINEKKLTFSTDAKRYYFDSDKKTLDLELPETDNLPPLIRNEISFTMEVDNQEITIILQNVNEFNLQPCRIMISYKKNLNERSKGCLIDRKFAPISLLDNIECTDLLRELTLEDLKNIPELETDPVKINPHYV